MGRPWVKLHVNMLDKPKIMRLPGDAFKAWSLLLLIAARHDREGLLPPAEECAFILHAPPDALSPLIEQLVKARALTREGDALRIHDWEEWQTRKPSDEPEAVRERVSRSRASRRTEAPSPLPASREGETEGDRPAPKRKRGTRIPDDFPTAPQRAELHAYGLTKGGSAAQVDDILEGYILWAQTDTTQKSVKDDWMKAGKGAIHRAYTEGRIGAQAGGKIVPLRRGQASPPPAQLTPEQEDEEARYAAYRRAMADYGFPSSGSLSGIFFHRFGLDLDTFDGDFDRILAYVRDHADVRAAAEM
jgi:hypothetical protein